MCYWLREPHNPREPASVSGQTSSPPKLVSPRPRWAAAVAVVLAALIVVAAMVFPSSTPAVPTSRADTNAVATTPVIEKTATTMDDGVPTSTAVKSDRHAAGGSHCNHDM